MGNPGKNDRGIYDDAMFIVWPGGVARFQANTDPSTTRKGSGTGEKKGMAVLKAGIHRYGTGKHKGILAFRQCEKFTVIRDGDPPEEHCDSHAINLHDGGDEDTGSPGCQTVPKQTWNSFRTLLYSLLETYENPKKRNNDLGHSDRSFDYVLIEETEIRKGNLVVSNRYSKR